jgi:microcystin-dependent protein
MKVRIIVLVALTLGGVAAPTGGAHACGSEPNLGEICTFGYNFCPQGFLQADGRVLQINGNQALYSLYGNRFGGDGVSNFGLPAISSAVDAGGKGHLITCVAVNGIYPMRP